jgi:hypothetical protein
MSPGRNLGLTPEEYTKHRKAQMHQYYLKKKEKNVEKAPGQMESMPPLATTQLEVTVLNSPIQTMVSHILFGI